MGAHVVTDLAPQTTPVLETNAPQLPISIVGQVVSISSRKVTLRVAGSESSYDISGIQIVQRTPKSGRDLSDEMQAQNIEALKGSVTLPPVPFTEKNIDASEVKSGAHMDILFDTDHRATRVVVMQ
jgi:hypothetical protein